MSKKKSTESPLKEKKQSRPASTLSRRLHFGKDFLGWTKKLAR